MKSATITLVASISLALLGAPALAQRERPDIAVSPVATLGEIGQAEKGILFNGLQASLSKHYKLVPPEAYAKAEKRAFEELDADNCTEEQCIRKIQELLQVERLVVLQIIYGKELSQLSLTLVRPEDKLVRAENCQGCGVVQLYQRIEGLVAAIAEADQGGAGVPAAPAQTLFSQLSVRVSVPAAAVRVDNTPVEKDPATGAYTAILGPGEHDLVVSDPSGDFLETRRTIKLAPGQRKTEQVALEPSPALLQTRKLAGWRSSWRWNIGLGLLAGALAQWQGQVVTDSNAHREELLAEMGTTTSPNRFFELQGEMETEQQIGKDSKAYADISLALAAVLLGNGILTLVNPPTGPSPASVLLPLPAPGGFQLVYLRRW